MFSKHLSNEWMKPGLTKPAKELKIILSWLPHTQVGFSSYLCLLLTNSQAKCSPKFSSLRSWYLSTPQVLRGSKYVRPSEAPESQYTLHTLKHRAEGMCLISILWTHLRSFQKIEILGHTPVKLEYQDGEWTPILFKGPPVHLKASSRQKILRLEEAKKEKHQPHPSRRKCLALLEGRGRGCGPQYGAAPTTVGKTPIPSPGALTAALGLPPPSPSLLLQ